MIARIAGASWGSHGSIMASDHASLAIGLWIVACAWPARAQPVPADQIAVSDPLLAAPEHAPVEVRSWGEALMMVRRSPDLLVTAFEVERTRAQERIALATVLPRLVADADYVHNFKTERIAIGGVSFTSPPPTVWSVGAQFTWNVLAPRALYLVGIARLETNVEELTLADRRRVLAATAVTAMLGTLAADRVSEQNRVSLRAALERLELTRTRIQFARGTDLDLDRAEQDVAASRAAVIAGDESLRQSREDLARVLGSSTPVGVPADLDLEAFERELATTCHVGKSIEDRADVIAAKRRVAIGQRQITAARLLYVPTIQLSSQAVNASASTLGPPVTWNVTAALSVPVYDGGARRATIRAATAATAQAVEILAGARIDAMIEAARSSRAIAVTTAERDVAREQRDLARRIDTRTREAFASGVGTSLDLVTSAQALRSAEIQLILSELRVAQARADAVLVTAECVY